MKLYFINDIVVKCDVVLDSLLLLLHFYYIIIIIIIYLHTLEGQNIRNISFLKLRGVEYLNLCILIIYIIWQSIKWELHIVMLTLSKPVVSISWLVIKKTAMCKQLCNVCALGGAFDINEVTWAKDVEGLMIQSSCITESARSSIFWNFIHTGNLSFASI